MIIEGTKDYATGEVLMISDGDATNREAWDWLRDNYGMHPSDGRIEKREKSEHCGMTNPATFTFIRANDQLSDRHE